MIRVHTAPYSTVVYTVQHLNTVHHITVHYLYGGYELLDIVTVEGGEEEGLQVSLLQVLPHHLNSRVGRVEHTGDRGRQEKAGDRGRQEKTGDRGQETRNRRL